MGLDGHKLNLDVVVCESGAHIHLLSGHELGLFHVLLVQDLLLRVTQIQESIVQFSFWNGTELLKI
jgi:hypothetical protein